MTGLSIGQSHPRPCTRSKATRWGRNNGKSDDVILIDVDPDRLENVIIIDVPESLPRKSRGSRMLGKDNLSFRTVICIDDDESINDDCSGIGVNDNGNFSNGDTNIKESDGGECQFVNESAAPVRLSKCKRTYSGKASTRNGHGPSINSETDLSGKDFTDCDLMEDSSGELRKQWEEAFLRRQKDKHSGGYDANDCNDTSKENPHQNVGKESKSGLHEDAPFCSGASKSGEENEASSPREDAILGGTFFQDPKPDDFSLDSMLKAQTQCNQPDISGRSHSGAKYPPFNFTEQQASEHFGLGSSSSRNKPNQNSSSSTSSHMDMKHSQPREPGAIGIVQEKENLISGNSSVQIQDHSALSSNRVVPVFGEPFFTKNSSVDPGNNMHIIETQVREHNFSLDNSVENLVQPVSNEQTEAKGDDLQHTQSGYNSQGVENCIINEREKLKETDEYRRAIEEEMASRQRALQIQAEEAQRLKQMVKRKKAESMRALDMERRQKQRLEEIRETQKKDVEKMNMKEVIRSEVRAQLSKLENTCHDMASLLQSLGIIVAGWPRPSSHEVQAAYKRALLTFHPDRASRSDIRQQVEAEEKFKLINRLKDKYAASLFP